MATADADEKKKPGPVKLELEHRQSTELLRLFQAGMGRRLACLKVGIGYNRFIRYLREDPEFAEAVKEAESMRLQACEYELYKLVTGYCDTPIRLRATIAYLTRHDRMVELRRARRDKARAEAARGSKEGGSSA